MTVLEAMMEIHKQSSQPMTAQPTADAIKAWALKEFKARDPCSIVRSAIRRRIRCGNSNSIRQVDRDRFTSD